MVGVGTGIDLRSTAEDIFCCLRLSGLGWWILSGAGREMLVTGHCSRWKSCLCNSHDEGGSAWPQDVIHKLGNPPPTAASGWGYRPSHSRTGVSEYHHPSAPRCRTVVHCIFLQHLAVLYFFLGQFFCQVYCGLSEMHDADTQ